MFRLYGSSAACETYGNAGLATTDDFVLKDVEVTSHAHLPGPGPGPGDVDVDA